MLQIFFLQVHWIRIFENCFKIICCSWIYYKNEVSLEYKCNGLFNIVLFLFNLNGVKWSSSLRNHYHELKIPIFFLRFCVIVLRVVIDGFLSECALSGKKDVKEIENNCFLWAITTPDWVLSNTRVRWVFA